MWETAVKQHVDGVICLLATKTIIRPRPTLQLIDELGGPGSVAEMTGWFPLGHRVASASGRLSEDRHSAP